MGFFSAKTLKKTKCFLLSKFIELRSAKDKDCENIYKWRNHELNRKYSLNPELIAWETHEKWFKTNNNTHIKILIARCFGEEIGVVLFNQSEVNTEISIYLVPGYHNKGHGLSILYAAESWFRLNIKRKDILARILSENQASISVFRDAGYVFVKSEKNYQVWQRNLK